LACSATATILRARQEFSPADTYGAVGLLLTGRAIPVPEHLAAAAGAAGDVNS